MLKSHFDLNDLTQQMSMKRKKFKFWNQCCCNKKTWNQLILVLNPSIPKATIFVMTPYLSLNATQSNSNKFEQVIQVNSSNSSLNK